MNKKTIIQVANELISLLMDRSDSSFIDDVVSSVVNGEYIYEVEGRYIGGDFNENEENDTI